MPSMYGRAIGISVDRRMLASLRTMSLTSTVHPEGHPAAIAGTCPDRLVRAIRAEVRRGLDWQQTAGRVARALGARLPAPAAILPATLRRGDPSGYQSHLLYAEPGGTFSVS